ncbi:hypothetical protein N7462_005009 [Penicillium macrosclerotiorum]|uniref:uncharacterized protein n=1 Tax=Penicillium macrosclerotiorum TaxID=303699 RepID=UPI002547BBF4|nr:uncharacterized protein N7462_005009 [Penicillium macrosclerotiorum]KAJ5690617.1 hypothetical protein N7462_005009 [Penicillium macrosclerotiorum]
MATPDQTTAMETQARREADYERFKTYTAYTFLVASPILIALPPRKLDHLTVLLASAFAISANHITREQTGRSIVDRLEARIARPNIMRELPSERAEEIQRRLRAARDAQIRDAQASASGRVSEEVEKLRARQVQEQGVAQRVWMGGEKDGWMEERLKKEQEALDEGKGYGDLIYEHIWEVWNWGKKQEEDED